jgi:hypothetical protein
MNPEEVLGISWKKNEDGGAWIDWENSDYETLEVKAEAAHDWAFLLHPRAFAGGNF